jgi:hypothetical protein
MEVGDQLHTQAALPPGKEPLLPIGYVAGWAPEPFSKPRWLIYLLNAGVKNRKSKQYRRIVSKEVKLQPLLTSVTDEATWLGSRSARVYLR